MKVISASHVEEILPCRLAGMLVSHVAGILASHLAGKRTTSALPVSLVYETFVGVGWVIGTLQTLQKLQRNYGSYIVVSLRLEQSL